MYTTRTFGRRREKLEVATPAVGAWMARGVLAPSEEEEEVVGWTPWLYFGTCAPEESSLERTKFMNEIAGSWWLSSIFFSMFCPSEVGKVLNAGDFEICYNAQKLDQL